MLSREERHEVEVAARMRDDRGWSDVVIRNVSLHGMLLQADRPPPPGSYLEIRLATLCHGGRAVRSDGALIGVRTRDPVDITRLQTDRRDWDREPAGPRGDRRRIARSPGGAGRPSPVRCRIVALAAAALLAVTTGERLVERLSSHPVRTIALTVTGFGHR